jgi:hypothetical protein
MKVLIIRNNLQVDVSDDIEKLSKFIKDKTPITVTFDYLDTAITPQYKFFLVGADGKKYYGTTGTKEQLTTKVAKNKYDAVIFLYNNESQLQIDGGVTTSWTFWDGLYPETEYSEIVTNKWDDSTGWVWKSLCHEFMHVLCRKLQRKGIDGLDEMDLTKDGQAYLHNDDPYYVGGNYTRTIANVSPYWNKLMEQKQYYEFFKDSEIVGLKPELVRMLDDARRIAGVPFKLNSGYRTEEQNKKVGGVEESAHTKGEAVDISCTLSDRRWKIVNALLSVGFKRIGVGDTFIHCDIDKEKAQNVIWTYNH